MTTARSSPPDLPNPSWARFVALTLVVPVELSSRLIEAVPVVVDKVPAAAGRVRREIVLARFLGKLVVDQGVRELRSRLVPDDAAPDPAASSATPPGPSEPPGAPVPLVDAPDSDTLALADYDHLSSAQIVVKLADLETAERQAIEMYELAGRHRRTILGKLDQLNVRDASKADS